MKDTITETGCEPPASAAEKGKRKKAEPVLIPKVQNMDNYLIKHYKSFFVREMNRLLAEGRIAEIIGTTVKSERILPGDCCFQRFNYWRINRCDFWIQIDLRLELQIQTSAGTDTDFFWFNAEFWFAFSDEGDEQCCFSDICMLTGERDYGDCIKLDKYLVPVLRRDEIDKYAEFVWMKYDPEAYQDPKQRNPRRLAQKMGLSIITLPLSKRVDTKAVLFFHDGSIPVQPEQQPGKMERPEPQQEKIPAMTIVLNSHASCTNDFCLDIYHECIHFEWHYLFYRLQDMHNNDVNQLKMVRRTAVKDKDVSNPVEFMEQHARYGSYALMMPASFMRETISTMYKDVSANKRKNGSFDHDGRRYDTIARNIASEYTLMKARVRARMIQLGYTAARGALNYVDGRYITPFAFSEIENSSGSQTYVIGRKAVAKLYETDEKFQKLMRSGQFAYVDGHVVHCDSASVTHTYDGARLSAWANAHIDRVSLRFSKIYEGNHTYTYTFGQMQSEEDVRNSLKFLDINGSMSLQEAEQAKNRLMEEMPMSFHSALAYTMKGRCTVDELIKRIPISRSTLLRLRTEERKQYNLDQIIAICIGLHLPPWLSEILLDKAGLTVKRFGPKGYYGTILDCFYMDTINEVQDFLSNNGYDLLNLNFDN